MNIISSLIICLTFFLLPLSSQAQTPTTQVSPQPEASVTDTTDQQDNKIDEIRQVVKDKVLEKLDTIMAKANQKIGWLGKVTSIEDNSLTITDYYQQQKVIVIDQDTVFINSRKQTVKYEDIKPDQIIIAMGYLNPESNLSAKRILITNTSLDDVKNTIILGTVSDISQTTSTISLVTKDRKVYQIKSDKSSKDLEKNQKVLATLKLEKKDSQTWLILSKKVLTTPTPSPTPEEE